jgi:aryl-alcohol dehydrogenase-like predicted oxidoreductase
MERPPTMSKLALGAYPLGGGYGSLTLEEARATVDAALDAGWTFIDTAEAYLDSEERLGRILEGRRDRVFIATKVFPSEAFSAANLTAAVDASLRRLRTDRIDLYQLHGPEDWVRPFGPTGYEAIGETLEALRHAGKIVHAGVCNLTVEQMRALALGTTLFSTQNLWSLIDRGDEPDELHLPVEGEILPFAREHGVHFLAWSPLSRGLLADGMDPARRFPPDDERHFLPRYQQGVYEDYCALAHRLERWARDRGRTLVQLAVAWTLSTPGVSSALIGAKSPRHVAAFAGADEWSLSEADLREVDELVATLPRRAKDAKMVVWDHFQDEALERLRSRRHGREPERPSWLETART